MCFGKQKINKVVHVISNRNSEENVRNHSLIEQGCMYSVVSCYLYILCANINVYSFHC